MTKKVTAAKPVFVSRCEALATDYLVYAENTASAGGPLPTVVVLDGDYFFDVAVAAARALAGQGAICPLRIIGIGYGKPFGDAGNRRGRDYTTSAAPEEPDSGGAPAFLEHLNAALWPEMQRRFSIDAHRSVLAGHSLSALFVLFAIFQPQPLFRRAIAGAPSLWWDNRNLLGHLTQLRERQATLPAEIYVGLGENETASMRGDLALFHEQLATRPFADLRVTTERFPDRDHYNVLPDLFAGGLRALFSPPQR